MENKKNLVIVAGLVLMFIAGGFSTTGHAIFNFDSKGDVQNSPDALKIKELDCDPNIDPYPLPWDLTGDEYCDLFGEEYSCIFVHAQKATKFFKTDTGLCEGETTQIVTESSQLFDCEQYLPAPWNNSWGECYTEQSYEEPARGDSQKKVLNYQPICCKPIYEDPLAPNEVAK